MITNPDVFGQEIIYLNIFTYITIIIFNTFFYLPNYFFISHTSYHKKCYSKNISNNLQSKHTVVSDKLFDAYIWLIAHSLILNKFSFTIGD